VQDLESDLLRYWPTMIKRPPLQFWRKEWSRHGTCATCLDSLSTPHKFFSLALQLRKTLSIDQAFAGAGIKPSCNVSYELKDIHSALSHLGADVSLQCYNQKGREILMQIKVSVHKDFTVGCERWAKDTEISYFHPCKHGMSIYLFPLSSHPDNPCP
uniref:Ribonuclease T2-like n=1 Tax=Callorhinchus milii TaxID=7868 RepID=A0A4W3H0K5_CALMI